MGHCFLESALLQTIRAHVESRIRFEVLEVMDTRMRCEFTGRRHGSKDLPMYVQMHNRIQGILGTPLFGTDGTFRDMTA